MWFQSLPLIPHLSQQRAGLSIRYNQDLTGKTKTILNELNATWRITPGLQLIDPSFFIGLGLQTWTFQSSSLQTTAPYIGWMGHAFKKMSSFDWQELSIKQSLPAKSSHFNFKTRSDFQWKIYQPFKNQTKLRYTLGAYTENAFEKRSGLYVEGAWVVIF